jgi:hypothetical protein
VEDGVRVGELDTATLDSPNYDPEAIFGVPERNAQ